MQTLTYIENLKSREREASNLAIQRGFQIGDLLKENGELRQRIEALEERIAEAPQRTGLYVAPPPPEDSFLLGIEGTRGCACGPFGIE